jgi:hypothetical protein
MAEPVLLVDDADRFVNRGPFLRRDLDVGEGEELKDLVLGPPDATKLVLGPASVCRSNDLAIAGALAWPAPGLEILIE